MDLLSGSETAPQILLQERGPDGLGAPVVAAARDGAPVRARSEVAARKRQRAALLARGGVQLHLGGVSGARKHGVRSCSADQVEVRLRMRGEEFLGWLHFAL